jgi:hypothetical protein
VSFFSTRPASSSTDVVNLTVRLLAAKSGEILEKGCLWGGLAAEKRLPNHG